MASGRPSLLVLCLIFGLSLVHASAERDSNSAGEDTSFSFGNGGNVPPNPNKAPPGSTSLKVPKLTEEEQLSGRLPDSLLCDACHAVAYQMSLALKKAEEKQGQVASRRGKPLRESEYLEIMEEVCGHDWNGYGIKDVDGKHVLSGPGLPAENHFSMMYGGGKWPDRLYRKCHEILGEVGEDELYELFREDNSLTSLCTDHSADCARWRKQEAKASSKKTKAKKKTKTSKKDEL